MLTFGTAEKSPQALLEELMAEQNSHGERVQQARAAYSEEMLALRKAQEELQEKSAEELRRLNDLNRERVRKIQELKAQITEQNEAKTFEETAKLVGEIVADYAAWKHVRHYQAEAVIAQVHAYLQGEHGMLNADEMGLGKTFETIVALYIIKELHLQRTGKPAKVLWLTKSAILETDSTKNEIARWDPELKVVSVSGSKPAKEREFLFELLSTIPNALILTNYETIRTTKAAASAQWDIIVMDEVHKLKGGANPSGPTEVWKSIKEICVNAKFLIILSGTPIVNRPEEIWSYLHIFDPIRFDSANEFRRQFSQLRQIAGAQKWEVNYDRLLNFALKGKMIRRTAAEVGQELPELVEEEVLLPHNPEQAKVYKQMRERFFVWLEEQQIALSATAIIAQLTRLRQINVWPVATFKITDPETGEVNLIDLNVPDSSKIDEAMEIIEKAGGQVVLGSNFNEPMEEVKRRCLAAGLSCEIISSEYKKNMSTYETDFQQGKIDVLCVNLAMGEGMNLQKSPDKWPGGASVGITLDRWWNSARNDQFVKRIYRPGHTGTVFFYHLYCEKSVDFYVKAIIDEKDAESKQIMDSDKIRPARDWKQYLEALL